MNDTYSVYSVADADQASGDLIKRASSSEPLKSK